jgi:2'-5' RNA ligase
MTDGRTSDEASTAPVVADRYGVFLTPDPATSAAVTLVTAFIRGRYGFVSAAAFPPHATLAGNLPVRVPEERLIDALTGLLAERRAFPVENHGVRPFEGAVIYDVHEFGPGVNEELRRLAVDVGDTVRPLLRSTGGSPADLHSADDFHAHISLASHELTARPDLLDEVTEFAAALPVDVPAGFTAGTVTLYRLTHPTWSGSWWRTMTWEHVRTFPLR